MTVPRAHLLCALTLAVVMPLAPAGCAAVRQPVPAVTLITSEEAQRPDAETDLARGKEPRGKEPSDGPAILVRSPEDNRIYSPPVGIDITFEPREAPVDLNTLVVQYVKFINIDITNRVRPYATTTGIHVTNADLPPGSHRVRLSISDVNGRVSVKTLGITVQ